MTIEIAIVDYGVGNLLSVKRAFDKVANENNIIITNDPKIIRRAKRIVLPGDGAFSHCSQALRSIDGMIETLNIAVLQNKRPFLGICVGMQLMADYSLENGKHSGLGWIAGCVKPITITNHNFKIPHMGWNDIKFHNNHAMLHGLNSGIHTYFVHSYAFYPKYPEQDLIATVDYETSITAIIAKDNMIGMQFHPEKSQIIGLDLINRFVNWQP